MDPKNDADVAHVYGARGLKRTVVGRGGPGNG